MNRFPEDVLEHIFGFIKCNKDRNNVSLVCKTWYQIESFTRNNVFVGNCYVITPQRVLLRFPRFKSLTIKGRPDLNFFSATRNWGGSVNPWVEAMVLARVDLEELCLKGMVVSDECLGLISRSFANFKSLVMSSCEGFSTDGLAAIASNCRFLRDLDLHQIQVQSRALWLNCFPDSCTTLVTLNFACVHGEVDMESLVKLVARCPNLRSLRLNLRVPADVLHRILVQAPQLEDLGVGNCVFAPLSETHAKLRNALRMCTSIRSLSGFLSLSNNCLPAIYPICDGLTSLNLTRATINAIQILQLIGHCLKLECLWVREIIGDDGLRFVAATCKELQELRIYPQRLRYDGVTVEGLVAVSAGCPKLKTLQFVCQQMTNVALITLARNCPNLVTFILLTLNPKVADALTMQPLDEGFGAIVKSCKGLKWLRLSGLVTDQLFLYIGMYAEQLEILTIPYAGDSDGGILCVLNGCEKLRELTIANSAFGDVALLTDVRKYEMLQSLTLSSCQVSLNACKQLAQAMPRLNVEIIARTRPAPADDGKPKNIYVFRTLAGPRRDAPDSVQIL